MESLNQRYIIFSICLCLGALSCSDVELERIAFLEVITVGVTDLGTSEVTLIGNAENLKNAKISESGFVLSRINKDDLSLRIDQSENLIEISSRDVLKDEGVFLSKITGLASSSTYYYRAYLMIEEEALPAYGAIDSFSTLQLDIAVLSINRISEGCPANVEVNLELGIKGFDVGDVQFGITWSNNALTPPTLGDNVVLGSNIDATGNTTLSFLVGCNDLYSLRAFVQKSGNEPLYTKATVFSTQPGGSWISMASIPQEFERLNTFHWFSTSQHGYVLGTIKGSLRSVLWQYDPQGNSWRQMNDPPFGPAFTAFRPSSLDRIIISDRSFVLHEYLADSDEWNSLGSPPIIGNLFNGYIYQDKVYYGHFAQGEFGFVNISNIDNYFPLQDFPGEFRHKAVTFLINDKGYFGLSPTSNINIVPFFNDLWVFDLSNNNWSAIADFPGLMRPELGFSMNGKGYVMTGQDENGGPNPEFWEYNPAEDEWKRLTDFGRGDGNADIGFAINGIAYGGLGISEDGVERQEFWKYVPELD